MAAVAQIGAPITFSSGTTAVAADVNTNFTSFRSAFNNLVTGANAIAVDVIAENTSAAGVTVDGVVLKDSGITATGGGSLTGTWTDLGSVSTIDINGGTIGGVTLDGTISGTPTWASDQAITLSTAAQPNITSLGTLTALTVDSIVLNGTTITGLTSVTSTSFVGDVTGNVSGSSGSTTGNAATATALQTARTIGGTSFDGTANIAVALAAEATILATARTIGGTSFDGSANIAVALATDATTLATPRTINGVSFDGSANITVTAAAGTLTGTTLKSTVVSSSLTGIGTIAVFEGGTGHFTGNVGIGQAVGAGALLITETGTAIGLVLKATHSTLPQGIAVDFETSQNDSTSHFLDCFDGASLRFVMDSDGGLRNYQSNDNDLSDESVKNIIGPLDSVWDELKVLRIDLWRYKESPQSRVMVGPTAQTVKAVFPASVKVFNVNRRGMKPNNKLGVANKDLLMYALRTIQELQDIVEAAGLRP